ncbi:Serine/threonine-protein kinase PrkC [Anatilimnocola aggregata]|uniref:non-specific serine/threonine protein kinase n=1 Tax=Anatilimnocola aggregata TaxID=2528021 RepID=A0A517Y666_9BACT|nr:serine/threonine-protein kinase [Anatilimnocola aggregata]QDU25728.1 Serine/threonine-protein kinase PrkC [Anatilimnocola aggregata]
MAVAKKTCPDAEDLQRVVTGQSTPEAEEQLAAHLNDCSTCGNTVEQLLTSDTLCEALQQPTTSPALAAGDASRIAERIKSLQLSQAVGSDPTLPPATASSFPAIARPATRAGEITHLGPYRIVKVLGRGGMGVVYQAEDEQLSRLVAIKAMLPSQSNATSRQRFLREARAAAALKHDHVVTIYQVGEDQGLPFIAMEFLEGESLEDRLERETTLPLAEVMRIGREIALGLSAAHQRKLIHRDIKPGNIWLEAPRGRVKVLDFGLARAAGAADEQNLTHSGTIVGTPAYMAPEQARGEEVDGRTDLFSLGCILYRLATGKSAFQGRDLVSTLLNLATLTPPAPEAIRPDLPARLSQLIQQLLAKDREQRPPSADAVVQLLESMMAEQGSSSVASAPLISIVTNKPKQSARAKTQPPLQSARWSAKWLMVAAGFAAAMIIAAAMVYRIQTDQGSFVVEINDPAVEIKLREQGLVLEDKAHNREFTIKTTGQQAPQKSGNYELKPGQGLQLLVVDNGGLEVPTQEFKLTRGDKVRVRIKLDLPVAQQPPTVPKTPDTSAPAIVTKVPRKSNTPYSVVGANGSRKAFKTFSGAIEDYKDEDWLEVSGDGPYELPPIQWHRRNLSIRAAAGSRPSFYPNAAIEQPTQSSWIHLREGNLRFEGCDFVGLRAGDYHLIETTGNCQIINCRLFKTDSSISLILSLNGPQNRVENSLLAHGFSHGSLAVGPKCELDFINNIYICAAYVYFGCVPGGGQRIRLEHNTFLGGGNLIQVWPGVTERVRVEATGNIFAANEGGVLANATVKEVEQVKDVLDWQGKDNVLWNGTQRFYVQWNDNASVLTSLAEWQKLWGENDQNTQVATGRFFQFDTATVAASTAARIQAIKDPIDARRPAGFQGGPAWDLIGPGEAFVRALAAEGRPVAEDDLRPEAIEGGPITLLRGGQAIAGYSDLNAATTAAKDGDVIELRTDREVAAIYRRDLPGKELTLRAGPGFIPQIKDTIILAKDDQWTIEGLHFKHSLNGQYGAECGQIRKLANCSFDPQPNLIAPSVYLAGRGEQGEVEITRCLMSNNIRVESLTAKQRLRIRDSIVQQVNFVGVEPDDHRLVVERTVFWLPGHRVGILASNLQKARINVEMHDCWLEGEPICVGNRELGPWQGNRNVFTAGAIVWFWPLAKPEDIAFNLADFQRVTGSDADSHAIEPLLFDSQQWKVLPGALGKSANSGGKDAGADVSRVATTTAIAQSPGEK